MLARIVAVEAGDGVSLAIGNFQRNFAAYPRAQKIVDHGPVWRILACSHVGRPGRRRIHVVANAQCGLRRVKMRSLRCCLGGKLAQRRYVIENQESAPVCRSNQVVVFHLQVAHRLAGIFKRSDCQ